MSKIKFLTFFILAPIMGLGCSNGTTVPAPPAHVLDALNKQCNDDAPPGGDGLFWCNIKFQILDDDHGGIPFGTGSSGTPCDGGHVNAPAGPIAMAALNSGGSGVIYEQIPGTIYCQNPTDVEKIQLDSHGATIAYGCGDWCLNEGGVKSLVFPSWPPSMTQSKPQNYMFVTGDSRCAGNAGGGVLQYKINMSNISMDYIGCSRTNGNPWYFTPGTIVITIHAAAQLVGGHVVCLNVNCS